MRDIIRAFAWYKANKGFNRKASLQPPPRVAVRQMLDELQKEIDERRVIPVALSCQQWPASAFDQEVEADFLALITVTIEPGEMVRRFSSWFEWQHPHWQVAGPLPQLPWKVVEHNAP